MIGREEIPSKLGFIAKIGGGYNVALFAVLFALATGCSDIPDTPQDSRPSSGISPLSSLHSNPSIIDTLQSIQDRSVKFVMMGGNEVKVLESDNNHKTYTLCPFVSDSGNAMQLKLIIEDTTSRSNKEYVLSAEGSRVVSFFDTFREIINGSDYNNPFLVEKLQDALSVATMQP